MLTMISQWFDSDVNSNLMIMLRVIWQSCWLSFDHSADHEVQIESCTQFTARLNSNQRICKLHDHSCYRHSLSVSLNSYCQIYHHLLSDLSFSQWQDSLKSWDFFNCFLAVSSRATVFSINILTDLLERRRWEHVLKCCSAQTCMRT